MTRLALLQRKHLIGELASRGLDAQGVIVANDENLEIATELGFATVEMDNSALGRRFNAGYRFACAEAGADYVVHIGSDDWIHPDCFNRLAELDSDDQELPDPTPGNPVVVAYGDTIPMIAGRSMLVVNLGESCATVIRPRGSYGVVPWILPRRALEPSNFEPVEPTAQRGIDGSLARSLPRHRVIFDDPNECARVDFKSDVNITPYAALTHIGSPATRAPWALLAEHYPQPLVEQARELAERGVFAHAA